MWHNREFDFSHLEELLLRESKVQPSHFDYALFAPTESPSQDSEAKSTWTTPVHLPESTLHTAAIMGKSLQLT